MNALGQTLWTDQIARLPLRPPPTLDEIRDKHCLVIKRERFIRMHEERSKQALEQTARTESAIYKLAKEHKGISLGEMREKLNLTEHNLRQVCNKMASDGRLTVKAGCYGKKYWYAV